MVHKKVRKFVRRVLRRPTSTSAPAPTGGGGSAPAPQSRPSGPVLVTPGGKAVGTPKPPAPRRPSGGGGGGITPPKIPPKIDIIKKVRIVGGSKRLTVNQRRALLRRVELKNIARARGKGFTRLETQRFLGGARGVSALRKAKRKGARVIEIKEEKKLPKKKAPKKLPTTLEIRKEKGFLVLEKPPKPSVIKKVLNRVQELETQKARANPKEKNRLNREIELALLEIPLFAAATVAGIVQLPSSVISLIKNPKAITTLPSVITQGGETFGKLVRTSPSRALVQVAGEILVLGGTGKAFKVIGKVSDRTRTILSPSFRKVKGTTLDVPSIKKGKDVRINIVGRLGSKGFRTEPLARQVRRAGTRVTAVSAQADKLLKILKTKRIVRKPIPNEERFSRRTKRLLSKFDRRRISRSELILLDRRVRKESGGNSLLERSFFADPSGRLRPSRLGRESQDASLLDILAGDITFRTQKPQVLIFEDVRVQQFPNTKTFQTIRNKLDKGKSLTQKESQALLKFQLKVSGKFKPIGSLTREPEITLAPGEIIKKEKVIAVTLINGRRVPIVRASVIKAKPETRILLEKAKAGKLKSKDLKKLKKNLKKETGFKSLISRGKIKRKVFRARPLIRVGRRRREKARRITIPRKPQRGKPTIPKRRKGITEKARTVRVARIDRRKLIPSATRRVIPRVGKARGVPAIFPPRRKKVRVRKKPPIKQKAFQVFARPLKKRKGAKRPKLIKINKVPLTKRRAKDLRNYIADTSLARTARIKPTSGQPQQPRIKVPASYSKKTFRKFRRHRIVKGKRIPLPKGKVIERRKFLLDRKNEKLGITLRRRIKQLNKQIKKTKSKRR